MIVLLVLVVAVILLLGVLIHSICYSCTMDSSVQVRNGEERWDGLPKYVYKKVGDFPKIKYRDFLNIYKINPKEYELEDGYVKRNGKGKDIVFSFTYFGYFKYQSFRKRKLKIMQKEGKRKEQVEMLKSVIEEVEKDIEMHKNKSKENVEFAKKIMKDIVGNVK